MKVVQCILINGNSTLQCWLENRSNLKVGNRVTLKDSDDPALLWEVVSVGTVIKEKKELKRPGAFFDSDI